MNLFLSSIGEVKNQDAEVAQALADVATIGILQERIVAQSQVVTEQLQRALDSRVLIEQVLGVLSQSAGLLMDDAFSARRVQARENNLTLWGVADGVVNRTFYPLRRPPVRRSQVPPTDRSSPNQEAGSGSKRIKGGSSGPHCDRSALHWSRAF